MSLKSFCLVLVIMLGTLPLLARADAYDAVNWARQRGCASVRAPLRENAKLRVAALQMAGGSSLSGALSSAGYLAAQSSAVHVSGAVSDAQVGNMLAAHYCLSLSDPKLSDVGVQRRGRDVWIVIAAPVSMPSMGDADGVRRQILEVVNRARMSGYRCGGRPFPAAPPLVMNSLLTSAASTHSQAMARYDEFDHRGHDGSSPAMRVERAGYGGYWVVGENIAAGAMTPIEVAQGWLASPAHCENIMDARFSEIGIAFAVNPASSELVYWTQDFAAPRRPRLTGR
jgi:uncharacterized protein YkwD